MSPDREPHRDALWRSIHARHPSFRHALIADARLENWFFGGSGFPPEYAPVAV